MRPAEPGLLLVLYNRPQPLPLPVEVPPTLTGDDHRVPYRQIKVAPQDPVHARDRVRDPVPLALARPTSEPDEDAPVELAGGDTDGRARNLGGDLVDAEHLDVPIGAGGEVSRDRWVVGDLLG